MFEKLPSKIPVFPLSGVIYFPKTNLPLNIFEQRYLDLVNDTLKKDKFMGMIQSKKDNPHIYNIGCLGKISDFKRSKDGKILINLTGLIRFEILEEIKNSKLYREFKVNYDKFAKDLISVKRQTNNDTIMKKVKIFFEKNGLLLNWKEFEKLDDDQKINTLAMIAPVTNEEKQKLLETITLQEKMETLEKIIDFYLHNLSFRNQTMQ